MYIMGIDQSLSCTGYSIMWSDGKGEVKSIEYGVIRSKKEEGGVEERINRIYGELSRIASMHVVDEIIIEKPIMQMGIKTGQDLAGLYYVIKCGLEKQGYRVESVNISKWKSVVGVKGKSRKEYKEESKRIASMIIGESIKSDDIADAVCMAYYLAKEEGKYGKEVK